MKSDISIVRSKQLDTNQFFFSNLIDKEHCFGKKMSSSESRKWSRFFIFNFRICKQVMDFYDKAK